MTPRHLLTSLVILSFLVLPGAMSEGGVSLHLELPGKQWFAARFNLTGPNDLRVEGDAWICLVEESQFASASYRILDGVPQLGGFRPSATSASDSRQFEVGVEGRELGAPLARTEFCSPKSFGHMGANDPVHSMTSVVFLGGEHSHVWLNASWSFGVDSWDVSTGDARMKEKTDFEHGASAATRRVGAGVAVAVSQSERTTHDSLGWFLPGVSPVAARASCYQDGLACDHWNDDWGMWELASDGGSSWAFNAPLVVELEEPPTSLALAEFPDDHFIYVSASNS